MRSSQGADILANIGCPHGWKRAVHGRPERVKHAPAPTGPVQWVHSMSNPQALAPDQYEDQFFALLKQAADITDQHSRNAVLKQAVELAKREHYAAQPPPTTPNPLADLRRDCVLHLRMCDILQLGEVLNL